MWAWSVHEVLVFMVALDHSWFQSLIFIWALGYFCTERQTVEKLNYSVDVYKDKWPCTTFIYSFICAYVRIYPHEVMSVCVYVWKHVFG